MGNETKIVSMMSDFGGEYENVEIDWNSLTNIKQLPKVMQIKNDDVKAGASYANFICYCDKMAIDIKYAAGVSGFTEAQVKDIIKEAKELEVYHKLANDFLTL